MTKCSGPILHAEGDYDSGDHGSPFDTGESNLSARTSRFLAVRYDLHLKSYTDDNQVISDFCQQLGVLRARYPKSFFDIFWVREHDKATAQHYH